VERTVRGLHQTGQPGGHSSHHARSTRTFALPLRSSVARVACVSFAGVSLTHRPAFQPKPRHMLFIDILEARNLVSTDMNGKHDPLSLSLTHSHTHA